MPGSMPGRGLAAHMYRLHTAAADGDRRAGQRLERLARSGFRAGQCGIDLTVGWHRHPGRAGSCMDESCPEATDAGVWARSWELYWPQGKHPGEDGGP